MFWLLRPRPRGCADQPGSQALPRTFHRPRVSLRPRLLPVALTSRALPCSGHGSDASRTFRAARSLPPCLALKSDLASWVGQGL